MFKLIYEWDSTSTFLTFANLPRNLVPWFFMFFEICDIYFVLVSCPPTTSRQGDVQLSASFKIFPNPITPTTRRPGVDGLTDVISSVLSCDMYPLTPTC